MKKIFIIITLGLGMIHNSVSNQNKELDFCLLERFVSEYKIQLEHKEALQVLGFLESKNNYSAIKDFGSRDVYFGKYQIHPIALKEIGMKVCKHKFKKDYLKEFSDSLQDIAVTKLMKSNKHLLRHVFHKKVNKIICGIKVTEYGICAGAHLVGAGNMYKFLSSNGKFIPKDGNNVPVTKYLSKFSNFNVKV